MRSRKAYVHSAAIISAVIVIVLLFWVAFFAMLYDKELVGIPSEITVEYSSYQEYVDDWAERVKPGAPWWSIEERLLGNGAREIIYREKTKEDLWRDIRQLLQECPSDEIAQRRKNTENFTQ